MIARKTKRTNKRACNLSLSENAVKQAIVLKKQLHRPSLSNVVEHLIEVAACEESKKAKG